MSKEEQLGENEVPQGEGSEANASGPEPQEEPLTVEDILSTEQNENAKTADQGAQTAAEAEDATEDAAGDSAEEDTASTSTNHPYLEDLRRLTAEYANYRKRTEANAEIEATRAKARVIEPLLSVLDDLDRAEAHGDLPEGSAVAAIATKLRDTLSRQGLEAFGEKGETFDPQQHEAIAQVPVPDAEPGSVIDVVSRGYRLGQVELRPAKVAVAVAQNG